MLTGAASPAEKIRAQAVGVTDFISKPFSPEELVPRVRALVMLKLFADEHEHAEHVILTLAKTIDARDPYTAGHSGRVAEYADRVADRMGLDAAARTDMRRGALFHDLGKIVIPDAILRKPGTLTAEERSVIEEHPTVGHELLLPMRTMRKTLPVVYSPPRAARRFRLPRGDLGCRDPDDRAHRDGRRHLRRPDDRPRVPRRALDLDRLRDPRRRRAAGLVGPGRGRGAAGHGRRARPRSAPPEETAAHGPGLEGRAGADPGDGLRPAGRPRPRLSARRRDVVGSGARARREVPRPEAGPPGPRRDAGGLGAVDRGLRRLSRRDPRRAPGAVGPRRILDGRLRRPGPRAPEAGEARRARARRHARPGRRRRRADQARRGDRDGAVGRRRGRSRTRWSRSSLTPASLGNADLVGRLRRIILRQKPRDRRSGPRRHARSARRPAGARRRSRSRRSSSSGRRTR